MEKLILIKEEDLRSLIREETEAVIKKFGNYDAQDTINNTYLNVEHAALFLKTAQSTLYSMVHKRKIPFIKQGRRLFY